MIAALAALLAASQPAPSLPAPGAGGTAWILVTVGHSEWCPAGNVRLDLVTGRYAHTATAPRRICNDRGLERPVREAVLDAGRLAAIRTAYQQALTEGLVNAACQDGGQPQDITISNGGTPLLVLATGGWTASAPPDLSCWSDAARKLEQLLNASFGARRY